MLNRTTEQRHLPDDNRYESKINPINRKLIAIISLTLCFFTLLINAMPYFKGPLIFFVANFLIQLTETRTAQTGISKIKLCLLPCFIVTLYLTNLVPQKNFFDEDLLFVISLFFLNCLLLPFSQLWLKDVNPFTHYQTLILRLWQNIINCWLIAFSMLLIVLITYCISMFILLEPFMSLVFPTLIMICIYCVFWFTNSTNKMIKKIISGFIILMKFGLMLFCALSVMCAFLAIFTLSQYDFMSHRVIVWNVIFSLTLFFAQTQFFKLPNQSRPTFEKPIYYLIFITFLAILVALFIQLTLFIQSDLINRLAPTVAIRLFILITLGAYIFTLLILFILAWSIRTRKSSQKKMACAQISSNTEKIEISNTLPVYNPNLAQIEFLIRSCTKTSLIFLVTIILFCSFALSPFFNLERFLADRHISRLLDDKITPDSFDFSLLENELGTLGREKFDDLIEIAESRGYHNMSALKEKYSIYQYGVPSDEMSQEEKITRILAFYKINPYQYITIYPVQTAIEPEVLLKIQTHLILFSNSQAHCLYDPNEPDRKINAKCFINLVNPDIRHPERKIYAVTNIYWSENNTESQNVEFFEYRDNQLNLINSTLLTKCDQKNKTKFAHFENFYQNFNQQIKQLSSPYYLLYRDDSVYEFPYGCDSIKSKE